jgi:hypothetical protein
MLCPYLRRRVVLLSGVRAFGCSEAGALAGLCVFHAIAGSVSCFLLGCVFIASSDVLLSGLEKLDHGLRDPSR